jgi:hypothetical protein
MAIDYFGLAGTNDMAGAYTLDQFGGDGTSMMEAVDQANGPYDYSGTSGGILYARDQVEQARMGAGYPVNGASWDFNAALNGVSRLIDSGSRAYAVANGMMPATYAGQNGLTYANGRLNATLGGNMLPLLLIGGALLLLMK